VSVRDDCGMAAVALDTGDPTRRMPAAEPSPCAARQQHLPSGGAPVDLPLLKHREGGRFHGRSRRRLQAETVPGTLKLALRLVLRPQLAFDASFRKLG